MYIIGVVHNNALIYLVITLYIIYLFIKKVSLSSYVGVDCPEKQVQNH
jgi:hypothetical protein